MQADSGRVGEAAGRLARGASTRGLGCPFLQWPLPSIGASPCLRKTLGGAESKSPRRQASRSPLPGTCPPGGSQVRGVARAGTTLGSDAEEAYSSRFPQAALALPLQDQPSRRPEMRTVQVCQNRTLQVCPNKECRDGSDAPFTGSERSVRCPFQAVGLGAGG